MATSRHRAHPRRMRDAAAEDQDQDFIGKEAIVAQAAEAPQTVLCSLTVDDHTSASG